MFLRRVQQRGETVLQMAKRLHADLTKTQEKLAETRDVMWKMRRDYLKDINNMRGQMQLDRKTWKMANCKPFLDVRYFD